VRHNNGMRTSAIGVTMLLMLFTMGCATKKMVRQNVQNLEAKIGGVDKKVDQKTGELNDQIKDVDRRSETGIAQAQKTGEDAAQQASKADQDAQSANALAEKGVTAADQVKQTVDSMDNPQPVKTETVLFGFNRDTLTDDDKAQLDALEQTVGSLKFYSVEVTGYTDKTGPANYNLELSRRRADAVVRYLTENDKIPLLRIHILGYGEDMPAADNHSRDGRKQNRRVEVKILAPQAVAQSQTSAAAGQAQTSTNVQ
jgi:OmpA-OmpF porin, OOP family